MLKGGALKRLWHRRALSIADHPRFVGAPSVPLLHDRAGAALPGCGGGVCAVPSCGGESEFKGEQHVRAVMGKEQKRLLSEFPPRGGRHGDALWEQDVTLIPFIKIGKE